MSGASGAALGRRRRTAAAGLVVAAVYLGGAALSGHLSVLARRPLLDGITSQLAYRWVSPPPPLAANNLPPHSATMDFAFAAGSLKGGVISPNDMQVTVIVQDAAVAFAPGQRSVRIIITPLDPAKLGTPPSSLQFDGNAYHIDARYEPSGKAVTSLAIPFDMAMVYPADATFGLGSIKHVILTSPTGATWDILSTTDLPGSEQASTKAPAPGYFVIGRSGGSTAAASSRSFLPIVIAGVFVLVILLFTSPRVIRRLRGRREREFGET